MTKGGISGGFSGSSTSATGSFSSGRGGGVATATRTAGVAFGGGIEGGRFGGSGKASFSSRGLAEFGRSYAGSTEKSMKASLSAQKYGEKATVFTSAQQSIENNSALSAKKEIITAIPTQRKTTEVSAPLRLAAFKPTESMSQKTQQSEFIVQRQIVSEKNVIAPVVIKRAETVQRLETINPFQLAKPVESLTTLKYIVPEVTKPVSRITSVRNELQTIQKELIKKSPQEMILHKTVVNESPSTYGTSIKEREAKKLSLLQRVSTIKFMTPGLDAAEMQLRILRRDITKEAKQKEKETTQKEVLTETKEKTKWEIRSVIARVFRQTKPEIHSEENHLRQRITKQVTTQLMEQTETELLTKNDKNISVKREAQQLVEKLTNEQIKQELIIQRNEQIHMPVYSLDQQAATARLDQVAKAADHIFQDVKVNDSITGSQLVAALDAPTSKTTSELVKRSENVYSNRLQIDGSEPVWRNDLRFTTVTRNDVLEKAKEIILNKPPVQYGLGEDVTNEDINRVRKQTTHVV